MMLEICIRCGIGKDLIIQDNKTFICKSCLDKSKEIKSDNTK